MTSSIRRGWNIIPKGCKFFFFIVLAPLEPYLYVSCGPSLAFLVLSIFSVFLTLLFSFLALTPYWDSNWEKLEAIIYKQLLREYVSHRPERDVIRRSESWEVITQNMNNYIQSTDFENVTQSYSQNTELSVEDVQILLKRALSYYLKNESSTQWSNIIKGVIKLRKKDLRESEKDDYQMFLEILDLSDSDSEYEHTSFEELTSQVKLDEFNDQL